MEDTYYITETTTWRIDADSEAEAREIWLKHWDEGVAWTELPMSPKGGGVEADWNWQAGTNEKI